MLKFYINKLIEIIKNMIYIYEKYKNIKQLQQNQKTLIKSKAN